MQSSPKSKTLRRAVPLAATLAALGLASARTAHAQVFTQGYTGLSSPGTDITFDSAPDGALVQNGAVTDQYASEGVTFQGVVFDPDTNDYNANLSGGRIGNFIPNIPATNPFSILFSTTQDRAAFSLSAQSGTATLSAYLKGVQVVSDETVTTSLFSNKNVFTLTGVDFDQIEINVTSTSDHAALVDNLQFGAPEPSSVAAFAFIGLGAAGLVLRAHRRKATAI